jgi:hypothetical protein
MTTQPQGMKANGKPGRIERVDPYGTWAAPDTHLITNLKFLIDFKTARFWAKRGLPHNHKHYV